jgi:hypothetical protein
VRGRSLFYVTTKQIVLDTERLSGRVLRAHRDLWSAFDPSGPDGSDCLPSLSIDRHGRGHFRISDGLGRIVISIRLRTGEIGPRLPRAGTHLLLFWKSRRLHRCVVVVSRADEPPTAGSDDGAGEAAQ